MSVLPYFIDNFFHNSPHKIIFGPLLTFRLQTTPLFLHKLGQRPSNCSTSTTAELEFPTLTRRDCLRYVTYVKLSNFKKNGQYILYKMLELFGCEYLQFWVDFFCLLSKDSGISLTFYALRSYTLCFNRFYSSKLHLSPNCLSGPAVKVTSRSFTDSTFSPSKRPVLR